MVDEETQDVASGSAGAPPNRDFRRPPNVIEGEVSERGDDDSAAAIARDAQPSSRPSPVAHGGAGGFIGGAIAGAILVALAAVGGSSLFAWKSDVDANASRLAEIDSQAERAKEAADAETKRETALLSGVDKRMSALETSVRELDKRLTAAASAANSPDTAGAEAAERLASQVSELKQGVDAARGEIAAISGRISKLESVPPVASSGPEVSALAARLEKAEAALATPKSETRVAADRPTAADNAAAIAIVAAAAQEKLAEGAPFAAELDDLHRLGVDPAQLAPLQDVVSGAPTARALVASFDAVAPQVLAATSRGEAGGVVDRLLAHMRGLVRVRALNETAGDDPQAVVSQIEGANRRGDIAAAIAAFAKLPEPARQAAGDWPARAAARQKADVALQTIRDAAIAHLAGGAKP
jgi:hypothetical protein